MVHRQGGQPARAEVQPRPGGGLKRWCEGPGSMTGQLKLALSVRTASLSISTATRVSKPAALSPMSKPPAPVNKLTTVLGRRRFKLTPCFFVSYRRPSAPFPRLEADLSGYRSPRVARTFQPERVRALVCSLSLAILASILGIQYAGFAPLRSFFFLSSQFRPCQKSPSQKTATWSPANTKSGLPGRSFRCNR